MVFIGGWRPRRRGGFFGGSGYGPRGYGPGYGYGPPPGYGGYGYRRGNSCLRDVCLLESGCCLAEALGCGPQLGLVAPSLVRRSLRLSRTGSTAASSATPVGLAERKRLAERTRRTIIVAIEIYQSEISPKRRPCCRFTPTCSHYAGEALDRHGLRRGLWLAARRLVRCRPGASGGFDPVPVTG